MDGEGGGVSGRGHGECEQRGGEDDLTTTGQTRGLPWMRRGEPPEQHESAAFLLSLVSVAAVGMYQAEQPGDVGERMCREKGKVEDSQGWIEIGIKRERGVKQFFPTRRWQFRVRPRLERRLIPLSGKNRLGCFAVLDRIRPDVAEHWRSVKIYMPVIK
jgi:hypothetical protein